MVKRVRQWMEDNLEYCADKNATPIPDVNEKLKTALGKVDPSCRSAAGLGPRRHQYRSGPKEGHFAFYKCSLGGGALAAVKLKTGASSSA
jgi:hypothetical protein